MIATVQLAQLGTARAVRTVWRQPPSHEVPGLRSAQLAMLAPLATTRPPSLGRAGLLAFWDDEDAADRFRRSHPLGQRFAGGLEAVLRPLRAHGSWPGLPADVATSRAVPHDGPVVVLTLARLRGSQTLRFARVGRAAERAATLHDGLLWGTAGFRFPFLATMTIWRSAEDSAAYAFGALGTSHADAMAEQARKDFHRQSAFIRFAPTRLTGALTGANPIDASAIAG